MALLNSAISLDWDGKSARPGWMRQKDFLPCDCTKCYFCKNGHTSGACRKRDREYTVAFKCSKRQRTKKCTTERVTIACLEAIVDCATKRNQRTCLQNKKGSHVKWWFVKHVDQSLFTHGLEL
jgi:hypothetical protein